MVTLWPLMPLQIRAGSTRHPFRTIAFDGPPPALGAFCDPHAAIAVDKMKSKAGKRHCIRTSPSMKTDAFSIASKIAIRYFDHNKL
jgi:hypothetical protein